MAEVLPLGWVNTRLGEIVAPSRARIHPDEAPGLPYVGLEHVEAHTMKLVGHGQSGERKSSSLQFGMGDVLYGKMRPYLNKVWVAEFDGLCSAEFLVLPKTEGLNSQFLAYRLNSSDFVEFANQQASGDRPRVDFGKLSRFPVLLPPSPEQDRIVESLTATLSKVAAGEAAAGRGLQRIERYRAAVLRAAVTGELTRAWRNTNPPAENSEEYLKRLLAQRRLKWEEIELKRLRDEGKQSRSDKWKHRYRSPARHKTSVHGVVPRGWVWASVEQLTPGNRDCAYGVLQPGPNVPTGVLLVRVGDVSDGRISVEGMKRVDPSVAAKYKRTRLHGGELLITLVGTIGRTAVVPESLAGANTARAVGVIPLTTLVNADWVDLWFRSPDTLNEMIQKAHEVARRTLNLEDVRAAAVPLPPLEEQKEIVSEARHRLNAAERLGSTLSLQLQRAQATRQSILSEAFTGMLVSQDPDDEPASVLLDRLTAIRGPGVETRSLSRGSRIQSVLRSQGDGNMTPHAPTAETLRLAWKQLGMKPDAKELFETAGFAPDQVTTFYELLRAENDIVDAFKAVSPGHKQPSQALATQPKSNEGTPGRFRLISLWLQNFKNFNDYTIHFDATHGLDIVLGWNGTGKSNLFESLVILFRDLHYWAEKNKWPDAPLGGYRLRYEIEAHVVEVSWDPSTMKRPEVKKAPLFQPPSELEFQPVKRADIPLPRFIFGYYSGPTNRLADHFGPMKREHYHRLRKANSDDPETLAQLLEQRRFFCAEANHAKYVLLAFSYKKDPKIWAFLESRLRIVGFESALFVIRQPRWGKGTPETFWGAKGIMRRVMEKLKRYGVAPMVLPQKVADGHQLLSEEHYYFFLPDLNSLHAFAAEYPEARSFFLALESTEFSELIHDLRIQVRVKGDNNEETSVTFHELSEGEQQLLTVLGLMRFTKSHQSLVLLDEPDTHLNPQWSVQYLKDLVSVVSDDNDPSPEQQTSQLLMATHDPLVIASLFKDQIHLLKRDRNTLRCYWEGASEDPRGLGYTGILLSDMFGFRSDLDEETLSLLDRQVQLAAKPSRLTSAEKNELTKLNYDIESLGFRTSSSDPYYRAFIEALGRRRNALSLIQKPVRTQEEQAAIRKGADEIVAALAEKHAEGL